MGTGIAKVMSASLRAASAYTGREDSVEMTLIFHPDKDQREVLSNLMESGCFDFRFQLIKNLPGQPMTLILLGL